MGMFSERLRQLRLQNNRYLKELAIHLHVSVGSVLASVVACYICKWLDGDK